MRATAITFLIGVLALGGFPGLSGFWSKDAILGRRAGEQKVRRRRSRSGQHDCRRGLTAFYATRMWMLAFAGEPRSEAAAAAHESPAVMTPSLWALATAVGAPSAGYHLAANDRFVSFLARERLGRGWLDELRLAGVAAHWSR